MRATVLGVPGGIVLGVSLVQLYEGVGMGMLSCADRHASPACEANYTRTAAAEVGVGLGLLACVGALWWSRRLSRGATRQSASLPLVRDSLSE